MFYADCTMLLVSNGLLLKKIIFYLFYAWRERIYYAFILESSLSYSSALWRCDAFENFKYWFFFLCLRPYAANFNFPFALHVLWGLCWFLCWSWYFFNVAVCSFYMLFLTLKSFVGGMSIVEILKIKIIHCKLYTSTSE